MARIDWKNIRRIDKNKNSIHTPVSATYTVFEEDGEKYLQIDTYGREQREIPGKISQSIQLSNDDAKKLMILLTEEFL
ncbi:MAG: methionyl-tRNA formyltransferase [Oscillospiraceae bacterium]|nr:methionyl-tRNA formyltransferase [Oscillospiraceae bacterium]